jgi:hypothetical protein
MDVRVFLEKEDYEKCSRLQTVMNEHYFADDKKQEDLNKNFESIRNNS